MTLRVLSSRKTKKGYPIVRVTKNGTKVIAHCKTIAKARKGIQARQAGRAVHW